MNTSTIKIIATSDIHGRPKSIKISDCDVLTISGDFSPVRSQRNIPEMKKWITSKFIPWMMDQPCWRVIFIAGNHDFVTEEPGFEPWFRKALAEADARYSGNLPSEKIVYLCHSMYEYKGFTFYGCPRSDIRGWAWTATDYTKYKCPGGVDVMLVHQAPMFAELGMSHFDDGTNQEYGSSMLLNALEDEPENKPAILLCGHIHSGEHTPQLNTMDPDHEILMANVSMRDERYEEYFYPWVFNIKKDMYATGTGYLVNAHADDPQFGSGTLANRDYHVVHHITPNY